MTYIAELEQVDADALAKMGQAEFSELEKLEAHFDKTLDAAPSIKGAMKVYGFGSADLWKCDPKALKVIEGFNPRVFTERYKRRIQEYAESMIQNGWFPNSVLKGYTAVEEGEVVIYITAGHTRLLALPIANEQRAKLGYPLIEEVPVVVKTKGVSMDDLQVELIRENVDQTLTPYEQGVVVQRMVRAGIEEKEIERRTGVKNPWLSKLLKLMAAPYKLKMMVAHEFITATLAISIIEEYKGEALRIIEESMAQKAKASNPNAPEGEQVAITKRDIVKTPEQRTAKVVSKFAPSMHQALSKVYSDPGVSKLSPETQALLVELMEELKKAQNKADGIDPASQVDPNQKTIFDGEAAPQSA